MSRFYGSLCTCEGHMICYSIWYETILQRIISFLKHGQNIRIMLFHIAFYRNDVKTSSVVMVALPNIGSALCSTPQSLADAHY